MLWLATRQKLARGKTSRTHVVQFLKETHNQSPACRRLPGVIFGFCLHESRKCCKLSCNSQDLRDIGTKTTPFRTNPSGETGVAQTIAAVNSAVPHSRIGLLVL